MDVILIGAGPVGLFCSYWLLCFGFNVSVYEGRDFTRQQMLYTLMEHYEAIPAEVRKKLDSKGVCKKNNNPLLCNCEAADKVDIHISSFQTFMLEYLQKNPKFTFHKNFISYEDICKMDQKVVIVCDGGGKNSVVHTLFKNPYKTIHIANSAVITYKATPEGVENKRFEELRDDQQAFVIHSSLPDYGQLGVQLTRKTFGLLKKTEEKDLLPVLMSLPEGKVIKKVIDESGLKNFRDVSLGVFPIDLRTAKRFYKKKDEKHFFLLGDSSFTTHYFTGMGFNTGLKSAKELVHILVNKPEKKWEGYNKIERRLRNYLWDNLIPLHLVDMTDIVEECRDCESTGKCIIKKSITRGNKKIKRNLRKRRYD